MLNILKQTRNKTAPFSKVMTNYSKMVVLTNIKRDYSKQSITNPQNLPHMIVPKLDVTLQKYLKTVEPHLTAEELKKTQNVVTSFGGSIGKKLQSLLEKRAETKENWLSDWWLENSYLKYRDPVVVFSSPGLAFPKQNFVNENDKIVYSAKLVSAALNYKDLIDNKKIPLEKVGKFPLDMAQYEKIFGTCRIPFASMDTLSYNRKSKHIILMINNNIFKVPVYGGNQSDKLLSESEIISQIEICIKNGSELAPPVGILTSDSRDNWAVAYQELIKEPQNLKTLKDIQSSLFVLSIDKALQQSEDSQIIACHNLIHGGGSQANSGNRWFDKTIQFVVDESGINGLTYEHSPAEGQPIAVMTDHILKYVSQKQTENSTNTENYEKPSKLEVKLSETSKDHIKKSSQNINKLGSNLDMNVLHFKGYGKGFIKSQKMSPDSYIQMAMQYAFYRLHGEPAAHYESAQTRMYVHGRTETIRSCSNESISFSKSMTEFGKNEDKVNQLKKAVLGHRDYTNLAMQGLGVDRHLLGLKLTALENNIPLPEIYNDAGFVKSAHMRLSTSQVASKYEAFMCYGPLVQNGYGCCYNPRENDMIFAISCFKSSSETSSKKFRLVLAECFEEMYQLLITTNEVPTSKL